MKIETILKVTNGIIINNPKKTSKIKRIQTDSRKIKNKDLFIAIKGEKFDGHDFIKDVIDIVSAIICEKDINIESNIPIIKVESSIKALGDLAKYKRLKYNIPLIAITGSAGKTTTKDLISDILSAKYNVLKNKGSQNNHIGLPKTLLKLNKNHEIIITELGMNHLGEISYLSNLCKPDYAIITNIGTAHIGELGSQKNILKAKLEILDGMNNGYLLVNGNDKFLKKVKYPNIIKEYIDKNISNIIYGFDKTTFNLNINDKEYEVIFNVPGSHLLINVILAIRIGLIFDVKVEDIITAIEKYHPPKSRMNIITHNDITIIDDSYNSSYEALIGSLELIRKSDKNKIIVLGDILELGKYSNKIHNKINKYLKKIPNKQVLLVGEHTKNINGIHFENLESLKTYLKNTIISNSIVLIKGSARTNLNTLVPVICSIIRIN